MQLKCQRNQWESDFFGREIYQVMFDDNISPNYPLSECEKSALFTAKVASIETVKIDCLQQQGFQLVQGEVDFCVDLKTSSLDIVAESCFSESLIRQATPKDQPIVQDLFATSFPYSRFRLPYFTLQERERFYRQWAENAINGSFDDICFIEQTFEKLKGAVTVRVLDNEARIGLLAVSPEYQKQGVAQRLMQQASVWAIEQGCSTLRVATQLDNQTAISFYQKIGAKLAQSFYWFYRVNRP